ncbi:MAG: iron ABC transporter permease [Eubacteriales bacterium]|nr:iron ABC transporter permease [Eubacteriales bacterium]
MKKRESKYWVITILLLFFIILPVIVVFGRAIIEDGRLNFANAAGVIADRDNLQTIWNSFLLGCLVVLTSTVIATPLAFLLSKTKFARYKWLDILFMIPFMTPPYISSMGWLLFIQKRGLFQQLFPWTGELSECMLSLFGLTLVMSFHVFPFMTTILKNAILNLGNSLEESALICGGKFFYRMRKLTLPLLKGNYAIAMLLVFVKTISEYGTPATFGKKIGFYVFTTDIHRYATTSPIDFGKAASLSSVLVCICMGMWMIQNYVTEKSAYQLVGGKGNRELKGTDKPYVNILGSFYIAILILCAIGIPYFSVVSTSFIKLRGYGLTPGNFTTEHYAELFNSGTKAVRALETSFMLAVTAATLVSVAGTLIVVTVHKNKKWKKKIESLSLFPEMIPNIVLVIGMMLFWNKIYKIIPVYNTMTFMVLVYTVMFLPYSIQYVSSSIMQVSDNLLMAGKVCGARDRYIFTRITLPLVMKGVFTGWMMTFIISLRELVASSLISPPNVLTVSTYIVREFEQGSVSTGMAMAVICVIFTTTALILLNQLQRKDPTV